MKRINKILTIILLLLSVNIMNVFADFHLTTSWQTVDESCNKGVCEGWKLRKKEGTSDGDIIKVRMYSKATGSAWTNFTEDYWTYRLKKDGVEIQKTILYLDENDSGLPWPSSSCFQGTHLCQNCTITTTSDDAYFKHIEQLSSGVYIIRGTAGKGNACNVVVSADGEWQDIIEGIVSNYTVSYNANGGIGSVSSQTEKQGQSIVLQDKGNMSRTGYTYLNWNTNSAGTGTNYYPGDYVSFSNDVTMYAKWEANKYKLTLNPNGGMIGNSTDNKELTVTYDSTNYNTVSSYIPKNGDWTFVGYDKNQKPLPLNKTQNENNKETTTLVYDGEGEATGNNYFIKNDSNNIVWKNVGDAIVYAKWIDDKNPEFKAITYNPALFKQDGSINYVNVDVTMTANVSDKGAGLGDLVLYKGNIPIRTIAAWNSTDERIYSGTVTYTTDVNLLESEGYKLVLTDRAGNQTIQTLNINTIDKVDPNFKMLDKDGNEIECGESYDSDGTIIIKGTDNYSGVGEIKYQLCYKNNYGEQITTQIFNQNDSEEVTLQLPVSGATNVMIKVVDKAGNCCEQALNSCSIIFNKSADGNIQLVDYNYVFKLYDKSSTAVGFISKLEKDNNVSCQSALKFIQNKISNGYTKIDAVKDFLKTYNYDLYKKGY